MFSLFSRKPRERQVAPQLSTSERRALELPGANLGGLSPAVYDQIERDAMIQTALTIKRLAVVAAPYRIEPRTARSGSDPGARATAAFVEEAFARMEGSPLTILNQAMDAFAKGWSVQEMVFAERAGRVWLRAARPKDPALFGLEVDAFGAVRGLTLSVEGEPPRRLDRERFVVYRHRAGYGRPKGRSDLDAAHPHWRAKQALLAAWRAHLERFASPTVLGRYARGMSADEQASILGALQNLHDTTAVVFPNEIEVGLLGGGGQDSNGFMEAIEFHNREMARAILGQTLTTDEGRRVGSLALGKVHLQVLLLQTAAIRRELADAVMTEQVVRPLVELNFGPEAPVPVFAFEAASLDAFSSGRLD
jgi:phage gp29-like protein